MRGAKSNGKKLTMLGILAELGGIMNCGMGSTACPQMAFSIEKSSQVIRNTATHYCLSIIMHGCHALQALICLLEITTETC